MTSYKTNKQISDVYTFFEVVTYDVRNQAKTRMMAGTQKHIRKVRYIPGHQKILACSEDQRIHYYDLDRIKTSACGWFWGHTGWVSGVEASKDQLCVTNLKSVLVSSVKITDFFTCFCKILKEKKIQYFFLQKQYFFEGQKGKKSNTFKK